MISKYWNQNSIGSSPDYFPARLKSSLGMRLAFCHWKHTTIPLAVVRVHCVFQYHICYTGHLQQHTQSLYYVTSLWLAVLGMDLTCRWPVTHSQGERSQQASKMSPTQQTPEKSHPGIAIMGSGCACVLTQQARGGWARGRQRSWIPKNRLPQERRERKKERIPVESFYPCWQRKTLSLLVSFS